MLSKAISLINFKWFVFCFICFLYSCVSDPSHDAIGSAALNDLIQEKLQEAQRLQDSLEFNKAIEVLQTIRQQANFSRALDSLQSNVYHKYGLMHFNQEDYHQAILYLDTAITIRSNITTYPVEQLANSYYIRSQAKIQLRDPEALADIQQAIGYIEKGGDENTLAKYYVFMAVALQSLGDFGQAEYYYKKVLDNANIEETSHQMALLYLNLGTFYALQKKTPEQQEALQKALYIYKQLGRPYERNYFATAISLGNNLLRQEAPQKAENYFLDILEQIIQSENSYLRLQEACFNSLAYANLKMHNFKKARSFYSDLLELSTQISPSRYNVAKAMAYEGIGDTYRTAPELTLAITHYHKAIQSLFVDFDSDNIYATPSASTNPVINKKHALRILELKASAHLDKYDADGQQMELEAALQIYQYIDILFTNTRQEFKAASSRFNIVKESIPIYEQAALIALQLHDLTQDEKYLYQAFNFATKNKAIVLQDGLQNERAQYAGIPPKLLSQENALKKEHYLLETEIIELESEGEASEGLSDKKDRLFEIVREYEALIQKLEQDYPKYYQLKYEISQVVNPNDIATNLPEGAAMIEFFVGKKQLFIFAISSKGLKHYALPKPKKLFTKTRAFRKILQDNNASSPGTDYADIAYSLYQYLLEAPLADLEKEQEIKRLIIIPDNQLLQISFDALLYQAFETDDEATSWNTPEIPYLLKKYAISYAYSNKLIYDAASNKRIQKSLAAFAGFGLEYDDYTLEGINELSKLEVDTTLSRGMGKLFHSVKEIEEVKDIIGKGSLWRNKKATKKSFLKNAPKYKVLHLAMHGYESASSPLNSALIFTRKEEKSDYILKAADLYTMSLHADMTVLSACHTATGRVYKGEGVRSLARAFRYAGCPSLLATLWSVSDYSTKEIIVNFYDHLKNGDSKDIALQKAKLNYLKIGQPSQKMPYFWSNLVLIGEPGPLDF